MMAASADTTSSISPTTQPEDHANPDLSESPATIASRGNEITGLKIFQKTDPDDDIAPSRVAELMAELIADKPTGGREISYGEKDTQHLRLWKANPKSHQAPTIVFVHGGSWRIGTNLDSIGSVKVSHLTEQGYAFASVNYTLIPVIEVEEQVQEIAQAISFLLKNAASLDIDSERVILMGHSSGAHVVTLLGTDTKYLTRAGVDIHVVRGVVSIDVVESLIRALGTDPERLRAISPTYHACAPNAAAFLLLHAHRQGDVRQAVELAAALHASGTKVDLRVFEGEGFEGHVRMLLRLGDPSYPATLVLEDWLRMHVPVSLT
ncbi:Alpha/Beta hydrolase protein [Penicillium cosmopolitanum]|uniref:Alpha/Beta hydrolase protein n=1 Tax=Penicillium cosmopolitanum TaxID=1131564 RepID=A0A9W9VRL0_9EURO|nr:Alpha/Beta hydrolase protein [Penicillium cosmopolitanum]KAJ5387969.1 Alpha/Beta hydrolase protein [Penicillium cosmopolitanum]